MGKKKIVEISGDEIVDPKKAALESVSKRVKKEAKENEVPAIAEDKGKEEKPGTREIRSSDNQPEANKEKKTQKVSKEGDESLTEKSQKSETEEKPKKVTQKKVRFRGKKYKEQGKKVDKDKLYNIEEAINLAKETSTSKFDGSIEAHIRVNNKSTKEELSIRGTVVLPSGTGKKKKIAVICDADKEKEAKEAGADFVGGDDLISKIEKGWLDFDILIASPGMMGKIGKLGKILGQKGLMPNPKAGTVTDTIAKTVENIGKGQVEFKADKFGIVHQAIGKVSFLQEDLERNFNALYDAIEKSKPKNIKGDYLKSIHICATMGPGIKIKLP